MKTNQNQSYPVIHVGIAEALAEIARRNESHDQAETRLREKMKPARLAPLSSPAASSTRSLSTFGR